MTGNYRYPDHTLPSSVSCGVSTDHGRRITWLPEGNNTGTAGEDARLCPAGGWDCGRLSTSPCACFGRACGNRTDSEKDVVCLPAQSDSEWRPPEWEDAHD